MAEFILFSSKNFKNGNNLRIPRSFKSTKMEISVPDKLELYVSTNEVPLAGPSKINTLCILGFKIICLVLILIFLPKKCIDSDTIFSFNELLITLKDLKYFGIIL